VALLFSGGECIAQSTSANRCIEKPTALMSSPNYFPDGPSTSPIWLSEVTCFGNEQQLLECLHGNWGMTNCRHKEDVGCRCQAAAATVAVPFQSSGTSDEESSMEIAANFEQSSGAAADVNSTSGFGTNFVTLLFSLQFLIKLRNVN
jgi:hypothetical protein